MHFYNWGAVTEAAEDGGAVRVVTDLMVTPEDGDGNGPWRRELERNGHLGSNITYLKEGKLIHA